VFAHFWAVFPAMFPTIAAVLSYLQAKASSRKVDTVIIQTNGALTRLHIRNQQLAAELNKYNVPIPPPIEGEPDERDS
jgi:4'-phosphopantetheinyl transferase EntD